MICNITRKGHILYCLAGLCIGWLDYIGWIGGLDRIGSLYHCIAGYCWSWIVSAGWIRLDNNRWMRTHSYFKDGTDGTDGNDGKDGLDGALVVLGWDGWLLSPAGTGATEQERHHCLSGYCKQGINGKDGLDGEIVGQGWDG